MSERYRDARFRATVAELWRDIGATLGIRA